MLILLIHAFNLLNYYIKIMNNVHSFINLNENKI